MFKLFRSRPPIIIINEAEHKEPTVIKEKSIWQKYKVVIYTAFALFHSVVLIIIINIMFSLKQNAEQENIYLSRQLRVLDSLQAVDMIMHYNDSISIERRNKIRDSVNASSFEYLVLQLKEISQENLIWKKKYE